MIKQFEFTSAEIDPEIVDDGQKSKLLMFLIDDRPYMGYYFNNKTYWAFSEAKVILIFGNKTGEVRGFGERMVKCPKVTHWTYV